LIDALVSRAGIKPSPSAQAELAAEKLKPEEGTITFKNYIIDALFHISADRLEGKADYEIKKI